MSEKGDNYINMLFGSLNGNVEQHITMAADKSESEDGDDGLNVSTSQNVETCAHEDASDEEPLPLPFAINQKLRADAARAKHFISIMRDDIAPNTGRVGSKWKWSHVRKVMADEGIIPSDTNDTNFGRIIGAMNIGVTEEQVRTNCKNNELRHLKRADGRRYDYTTEFTECTVCMEVADALKNVIECVRE